jgi:glycogen debranching enzyme
MQFLNSVITNSLSNTLSFFFRPEIVTDFNYRSSEWKGGAKCNFPKLYTWIKKLKHFSYYYKQLSIFPKHNFYRNDHFATERVGLFNEVIVSPCPAVSSIEDDRFWPERHFYAENNHLCHRSHICPTLIWSCFHLVISMKMTKTQYVLLNRCLIESFRFV